MISPPLPELQQLARNVIESEGMELVELQYKIGRSRSLLRILIDKKGGVTLGDCENISRQLAAILDVKDLLKQAYVLEVGSPGVDRPLKTDRDYERSLGRRIHVWLSGSRPEEVIGKLVHQTATEVWVDVDGQVRTIPKNLAIQARQEIELGQSKAGGKKRKRKV